MLKQFYEPDKIELGIDEAGRGCLFGPVCVACVSLTNFDDPLVNQIKDSDKWGISFDNVSILPVYSISNSIDSVFLSISDKSIF